MTVDRETVRRLLAIAALIGAVAAYLVGAPPLALAVAVLCIAVLL